MAEITDYLDKRRPRLDAETKHARRAEQMRRANAAVTQAHFALARKYRDEFRTLRAEARRRIDTERGPLPGDDNGD